MLQQIASFYNGIDPLLNIVSIASVRDDRVLFSDLSFSLQPGQVLIIEGRNGSGKTTLLRMLCGLRYPDEGEILWQDRPIETLKNQYYEQFSYVGHLDGVKRELTPAENLRVTSVMTYSSGIDEDSALAQVGLQGFEDVVAQQLSAGQRKRVALARLLISDCPLWILDEAFTALDRDGVKMLEGLIEKHINNNGMVIMTSHQDISLPAERLVKVVL